MEIPSKYNPAEVEGKWYKFWMDKQMFHSEPDERESYTILMPPPNVTGVLHMGHMLNNTIQDILVRRARMTGKNACWVPGTDHASIATEAKVVNRLKEQGIDKADLSREDFMKHAWDWTDEHGSIILKQLQKLGASADWDRTYFTLDETRSEEVYKSFIDLFNKGLIYRGVRMVNWDPSALTALSDEEVIHKEVNSKLYYLKYQIEGSEEFVTIATTRPETILGDTAVCINPNDERFAHLKGKNVIVPLVNRVIPIVEDEHVDVEFGTGCLKITPAHDVNDYEIGMKYNLDVIDIFNDNGTVSEAAGMFVGEDRFDVRKSIIPVLEEAGNLVKIEDYTNKVGFSERTDVVIEPKLSAQWYLKMEELVKPAKEHVMNDDIQFHPAKFKNVYRHWMDNIKDWCVSRQLYWGHRIPVYYLEDNSFVVAETPEKALEAAKEKTGNAALTLNDLRQEEDVLDTWASSWLLPISAFKPDELDYYYPTTDLVTGHDIIFFWVARMIIAGYEFKGEMPFKNVYFTGMVRDKQRRKMSKSLGNSPDPLDLIEKYGADGVRLGMLLCSPAGGDILYDDSLPAQGANFTSKIWNSFRLVKGWDVDNSIPQPEYAAQGIEWFNAKLDETIKTLNEQFEQYRLSEALMTVYNTVRDEFSGWLLEIVKPAYQKPIDGKTYNEVIGLFDKVLRILHPFMPFITEEVWHLLEERKDGESIMLSSWPELSGVDASKAEKFENVKEAISGLRTIRKEKNIANKESLALSILKGDKGYEAEFTEVLNKIGNLSELNIVDEEVKGAISFRVKTTEFYVPLGDLVNVEEEIEKIEAELKRAHGFLIGVNKKLGNEKFVNSAPAKVVELEQKKLADGEAKIKMLEERLATLK